MNSINKTARLAGLFYLLFFITTIFAGSFVRDQLIVPGDAGATASNILASAALFRLGFMSDLLAAALFLLAAWALYRLLKPVHNDLALLFVLLNLGGVAIQCLSLLQLLAAQLLLSGGAYSAVFPAEQLQALALFCVSLHQNGFMAAQLFYGAWLFPLGYLIFKSGFLPKWLGVLLLMDGVGVLIWFFQFFLFPGYAVVSYPGLAVSFVAEVSLSLWLLVKGAAAQPAAAVAAG